MLSLPITPFSNDIAKALGADPTKLLLAQYRQDLQATTTSDKYLRYPSLPLYQPGYGLWGSFPATGLSVNLVGQSDDIQQDISVPAQFGWVQIGNPYSVNLNSTSQIFTQYLGGEAMSFTDAVLKGLISPGIIAYSPTTGYADITLSTTGSTFPQNTLEPWKGYWIRVLVTEGVTLSYLNPNAPTRKAKFKTRAVANVASDNGFWRIPLTLSDGAGNKSVVQFGQSSKASEAFTPSLDVASPPPFTRAALPVIRFMHNDWNLVENGSEFLSDFRRSSSASQWDAGLSLPTGEQDYTLTWNDTAKLPRGTRLTLIDRTSGKRQLMNSTSSYSFRAAKDETTRRFQIVAEPRSPSLIQVQNLRVEAGNSRAVGMTVAFELSAAAETTVEIQLNGRSVRRLTQGRAASVGTNQMLWDLKDDQGRSLPGGLYRISVTARTPEGAQTRQIIPALITR